MEMMKMSHGVAMLLNMLVWLAITAVVVGVPVVLFKAVREWMRRNKIKKDLKAEYGDGWRLVYHNMFRRTRRSRKENENDMPTIQVARQTTDRPQVFQPTPRPQFDLPVPQVSPVEYNLYPVANGPVHRALMSGAPRLGRDWYRGVNAYWAVKDAEIEADPRIHGKPGVGLNTSGFSQANISAGQRGERNLAKLMHKWGLTHGGVETYWSMALPNSTYDTDVDAIMVYGNTVYLIDAKNYSVGEDGETYVLDPRDAGQSTIVRVDRNGNIVAGSEHKLSQSMVMAVDKYTPYLKAVDPNVKVVAAVVLCPDKNGTPAVAPNLVTLQGKMPVMSCATFLQGLKQESNGQTANPAICAKLQPLLKTGGEQVTVTATSPVRPAQTKTYTTPVPAPAVPSAYAAPAPAVVPAAQTPAAPARQAQPFGINTPPLASPAASFSYDD